MYSVLLDGFFWLPSAHLDKPAYIISHEDIFDFLLPFSFKPNNSERYLPMAELRREN